MWNPESKACNPESIRPSWIPLSLHEVKKPRLLGQVLHKLSTLSIESQQPIAVPKALKSCAQFLEN